MRTVKERLIEYDDLDTVSTRTPENQVKTSRNTSLRDIGREAKMFQQFTFEKKKKTPKAANLKKQTKRTKSVMYQGRSGEGAV